MSNYKNILIQGGDDIAAEKNYDLSVDVNLPLLAKAKFLYRQEQIRLHGSKIYEPIAPVFKRYGPSQVIEDVSGGGGEDGQEIGLSGVNGNISAFPLNFSDSGFRAYITSTGLPIYRYPGGVANTFNWRTGLDDTDLTGQPNLITDVAKLVQDSGCEVMFCLNIVTKDIPDQLELLSTAVANGINITRIELGNEINNANNIGHTTLYPTPQAYRDAVKVWKKAIQDVYPDALVSGVGENKTWSKDAKRWNEIVAEGEPNALVWHEYADPNLFADELGIIDFKKLDDTIMNDRMIEGMDKVTLPIWVTEYNLKYDDKGHIAKFVTDKMRELGVLYMTKKFNDLGIPVMCMHNIVGKEGFVDYKKKQFVTLPSGIGLQTWFDASKGMTSIEKVPIQGVEDWQVFVRKFSNASSSRSLYVNLTAANVTVEGVVVPAYDYILKENSVNF